MFSVHTTPEGIENATISDHFGLWSLRKTRAGKSHDHRVVIVLKKLRFQNVFRPHENKKPAFSNSSGLKSVFEKFRFLDGLVWTLGLTVEIKQRCVFKFLRRSVSVDRAQLDFLRMKRIARKLFIRFCPENQNCLIDFTFLFILFALEMAELKDQLSLGGANVNQA